MKWLQKTPKILGLTVLSGGTLHLALYDLQGNRPSLIGQDHFATDSTSEQERKRAVGSMLSRVKGKVHLTHILMRERSFVKQFQLPSRNPDEIRQMVILRLPREIPFSLDQVVFHFHPTQSVQPTSIQTNVFLFAVTKEIVNQERALLRTFGLDPNQIVLSSVILSRFAHKQVGTTGTAPKVILFGSHGKGELLMVQEQGIQVSRSFNYSGEDLSGSIQEALQPIVESLNREGDTSAYDLCTAGDIDGVRNEILPGRHPSRTSLHPPSSKMSPSEFLLFAGALAYDATYDEFNLLPEEEKTKRAQAETASNWVQLRFASLVFLAIVVVASFIGSARTAIAVSSIHQKLQSLDPSVRETKHIARAVETLYRIEEEKILPLDVMIQVHEKAPIGILLNEMEYNHKDGYVRIKGRAANQSLADQFVRQLEAIIWFARVDLQYSESVTSGLSSEFQFSIQATFKDD